MKEAGVRKQAVLLMSHFFNRTIEEKYNRLCRELDEARYDVFLLLNVNDKQTVQDTPTSVRLCLYDANDLNELGYTPIYEKLLPGSCHFPVLKFFLEHQEYNFYWFIEYDVEFTAPWNVLMDFYKNDDTDYLVPYLAKFGDFKDCKWKWWFVENNSGFPLGRSLRAFHPICRYSESALYCIDKYQAEGHSAHSEILVPTCLFHAGMTLGRLDERFFIKEKGFSSFRYRPAFSPQAFEKRKVQEKLYHPVKL